MVFQWLFLLDLIVEVKQLKETVEQKMRNLEMAEKKNKDLEVRIDVLTNFFREKESDLNQSVDIFLHFLIKPMSIVCCFMKDYTDH